MVVWSTRASKTLKEHCIFMNRWLKDSRNLTGQSFIQNDSFECVNSPLWFFWLSFSPLSTGNNHSSHGSEPHHVGSLQEIHPGVTHSPRQSAAAAQIHLTDSRKIHQGRDRLCVCVCFFAADVKTQVFSPSVQSATARCLFFRPTGIIFKKVLITKFSTKIKKYTSISIDL